MPTSRVASVLQTDTNKSFSGSYADLEAENTRLHDDIARLRLKLIELERAADTDPLVAVFNRRAFMRELGRAQSVYARYGIPSSVIFFDLNAFKSVNDRFGHSVGDQLLRLTGKVLVDGVRQCDLVARIGGDEFGIILFKTDIDVAEAKAATLSCRLAEEKILVPTGTLTISAAWGVAPCDPSVTPTQVLSKADKAMYMAKNSAN